MFVLTSIAWPYRGLRYRPTEFECFFEGIRWQVACEAPGNASALRRLLTSCYFSNDHRLKFNFFKCIWNRSCLWAAFLKFWFRTDFGRENSTRFYMLVRQSLLTFLPVTRWSRSTSNFYVLIGQNLTSEFMRKIYAASGDLLTDSWSWQCFVSSCDVLNCFFSTWCTKWNTAAIKIVL